MEFTDWLLENDIDQPTSEAQRTDLQSRWRQAISLAHQPPADLPALDALRDSRRFAGGIARGDSTGREQVIEAALLTSFGCRESFLKEQYHPQILDTASSREYRGMSIGSLLFDVIGTAGVGIGPSRRVNDGVIRRAFEVSALSQSSYSVPGILSNVANKLILDSYSAVPVIWPRFCDVSSANDFKAHTRYRLLGSGIFEQVAPGGELLHMSLTEQTYTITANTYGRLLGIDRTDLINDDAGAFSQLARVLGRAGAVALEKSIFTLLLANTGSFFHTNNSNLLTGAGSALAIAGLNDAEKTFLKFVDNDGYPVMTIPRTLVVPPDLSATAAQLIGSVELLRSGSDSLPTGNPHSGKFDVAASPWLNTTKVTGGSATRWFLFADPAQGVAALEVSFLGGQRAPTIETAELDFKLLGVGMRAFHDWGVAFQDPRAAVRNDGV